MSTRGLPETSRARMTDLGDRRRGDEQKEADPDGGSRVVTGCVDIRLEQGKYEPRDRRSRARSGYVSLLRPQSARRADSASRDGCDEHEKDADAGEAELEKHADVRVFDRVRVEVRVAVDEDVILGAKAEAEQRTLPAEVERTLPCFGPSARPEERPRLPRRFADAERRPPDVVLKVGRRNGIDVT